MHVLYANAGICNPMHLYATVCIYRLLQRQHSTRATKLNLQPNSSNKRIHRRRMRRRIHQIHRPRPRLPQLIILQIPIMLPNTLRRSLNHLLIRLLRRNSIQRREIADKNALELGGVRVAGVWVAGFFDDVGSGVGECFYGGFGDVRGGG